MEIFLIYPYYFCVYYFFCLLLNLQKSKVFYRKLGTKTYRKKTSTISKQPYNDQILYLNGRYL